jgi:hypothetical protein
MPPGPMFKLRYADVISALAVCCWTRVCAVGLSGRWRRQIKRWWRQQRVGDDKVHFGGADRDGPKVTQRTLIPAAGRQQGKSKSTKYQGAHQRSFLSYCR